MGDKMGDKTYQNPSKHQKINKEGIKPDFEVDLTKDSEGYYETGFEKDTQILKAIEILK